MRRTQLFLPEDLWQTLRLEAKRQGETVSELARIALREKYQPTRARRREAMMAWVGIWEDRTDLPDTETYVRSLRSDKGRASRLEAAWGRTPEE